MIQSWCVASIAAVLGVVSSIESAAFGYDALAVSYMALSLIWAAFAGCEYHDRMEEL